MKNLPDIAKGGERARLFPVLADTSKEGRTLSIFLACLENIPSFGRILLGSLGQSFGTKARIETYTEVKLVEGIGTAHRPDGLIVVSTGKAIWTALVEAKVGASQLTNDQIEAYLEIARRNNVDAVITLSNQFASLPTHHPLTVRSTMTRRVNLFHWSWGYVITQAHLLAKTGQLTDREQIVLLQELQRFLLHPSSGVKEFDQMPAAWSDLCDSVMTGTNFKAGAPQVVESVGAWHQLLDHLTSQFSRQLDAPVEVLMSRAEAGDQSQRMKEASLGVTAEGCLRNELRVPGAAAPINICADFRKRSITVLMRLRAPADRKTTKAKVNWLLRQLAASDALNLHIRLLWPGRAPPTQFGLQTLRDSPEVGSRDREGSNLLGFEVLLVRDLGSRFGQRKMIVTEMLRTLPEFYEKAGGCLTAWQARPTRLSDSKAQPESVSVESLREDIESEALEREP